MQFKNQRQFCFGNRQYLQREIILECCLHQGMGVSNHETNAHFLTKFTLSVHLLASTPRQTLIIFDILKNKIIKKNKKNAVFDLVTTLDYETPCLIINNNKLSFSCFSLKISNLPLICVHFHSSGGEIHYLFCRSFHFSASISLPSSQQIF